MSFVKVRFLKSVQYLHCSVSTLKIKVLKGNIQSTRVRYKEKIQITQTYKYLKNRLLLRGKVILTFLNASQFMLHVNAIKIHI